VKDAERRYVASPIEMRGMPGQGATLIGHAAVFNAIVTFEQWFREQVIPGAFKKSIKESDVRALFNHDPNHVLGRNKANTLRLSEDDTGLAYEIDLPDTQLAIDLAKSIDRGDISQSSFAFSVVKESWDYPAKGSTELPLRSLREVKLYDVSPVTYPAYEGTDVDLQRALRSLAADLSRPLDELVDAARDGHLADTTQEPEAEPREHSEATQEPDWKARARRELDLIIATQR
jgi:uncharacterized protein